MRSNSVSDAGQRPGFAARKFQEPDQVSLRSLLKAIIAEYLAISAARHAPEGPTYQGFLQPDSYGHTPQ